MDLSRYNLSKLRYLTNTAAATVPNGVTLTVPTVLADCRGHLEDLMVPRYVRFRSELPKTASGKTKETEFA